MVAVVQLVEHQVVILGVAGSSPVSHPDETGPPPWRGPLLLKGGVPGAAGRARGRVCGRPLGVLARCARRRSGPRRHRGAVGDRLRRFRRKRRGRAGPDAPGGPRGPLVHGFVKQSSGHVEILSEVGRGTTVRIYLPRAVERRAAPAAGPAPSEPVALPRGTETILMVEDNESVRKTGAAQLASLGYRVLEATQGWEALAILERSGEAIDLLFTDIVMPGGMDGHALARAAAVRRPHLKVLLTSGFPGRWSEPMGDRRSDLHLLSKPYSQDDLAKAIWAALHRS